MNEEINKYLGIVDRFARLIPYKKTSSWKAFFLNPESELSKPAGSVKSRLIDLYVASFVNSILLFLPMSVSSVIYSFLLGQFAIIYILFSVVLMIAYAIFSPLFMLIYSGFEYVIAKLLGGAANFKLHFNASVLPFLGAFIISLPIGVADALAKAISTIPFVGCLLTPITLPLRLIFAAIFLYSLYLRYVAFKKVHKFSAIRSAATIFIPIITLIAILTAVIVVGYFTVIAALAGPQLLQNIVGSSNYLSSLF